MIPTEKYHLRFLLPLFAVLCFAFSSSPAGFMQIRNFSQDDYRGGPQNWDVAQDSLGRIYVANRNGLMAFDGERWVHYALSNSTTVRSLLYHHPSRRIYAAGTEEFGWFEPDSVSGNLRYRSLMPTLGRNRPSFTEIWNIMALGNDIWFQADDLLLKYDGTTTTVFHTDSRISCSALVDDRIYVGVDDGGILTVDNGALRRLGSTEILAGKKIRAILPGEGEAIVATSVDGLFRLGKNGVTPMTSDIDGFLRDNQLFCAAARGPVYVFGTVTRGAVVKNLKTGATQFINKESGMQNNTVLRTGFDRAGNIWLCLDNGVDYAIYNSAISNLVGTANGIGAGYTSFKDGGMMYFGTNQGLYSASYPFRSSPAPISLSRELQGQIWSISPAGDSFFVAGDAGVYVHHPGGFSRIPGLTGSYRVERLDRNPDIAVAASYDGFHLLKRSGATWQVAGTIAGDNGVRGSFVIDGNGDLWTSHWLKGVYRLRLNIPEMRFDDVTLFTEKEGLPSAANNAVTLIDGKVVVTNPGGYRSFDPASGRMVPLPELSDLFSRIPPGTLHAIGKRLVLLGSDGIAIAAKDSGGRYSSSFIADKSLEGKIINGYEHVNIVGDREFIIGNQNGFWSIDPEFRDTQGNKPRPFVSMVMANGDSLVYRAGLDPDGTPQLSLPWSLNSLRFEFSCPEFRSEKGVLYSSLLEKYDKSWSTPSEEASREYTQLGEGDYTLRLRALNLQTGEQNETSFRFRISPPWYRSVWARLIYLLAAAAAVVALVLLANRWKHNAERRVEKKKEEELEAMRKKSEREALQKDYEIATLKSDQLEIDIRHKSDELSSATMNLIRKNEILHEIASKIAKIQETAGSDHGIQKQLGQIQQAIEQNISHDDDWATFNRNFDIVYGDYTKRLQETFPQLTKSDMRLCCYIKMGLSSKEIAPLVNISFKSVEMARYRLRKKMGLDTTVSLTDYLSNF